jgi:hypothetical protein
MISTQREIMSDIEDGIAALSISFRTPSGTIVKQLLVNVIHDMFPALVGKWQCRSATRLTIVCFMKTVSLVGNLRLFTEIK